MADGDEIDVLQGASLLVNAGGAGWMVPETTAWDKEATLRDLLTANPTIIPGVTSLRAAAACEFRVPGIGSVDVVAVESDGSITIVEAKLAKNPEIKRKVIGQVFAYAAGLSEFDLDDFEVGWHARADSSLADSVLGDQAEPEEISAFHGAVAETLRTGEFRIVVAVDGLTDELRSTITYLAEHSNLDVAALELAYASTSGVEILVPKVWGLETSREQQRSQRRRQTKGYRATVEDQGCAIVAAAEARQLGFGVAVGEILDALAPNIAYLYSGSDELLDPVLVAASSPDRQPAKLITSQKSIGVRVCFHWCQRLDATRLDEALHILEADPHIAPIVSEVRDAGYRKGPLLPFEGVLENERSRTAAIRALQVLFRE